MKGSDKDLKSLGYVARNILEEAIRLLQENQGEFFDVAISIRSDKTDAAIQQLKEASDRNLTVIQALTLLRAGHQHDAARLLGLKDDE